MNKQIIILLFLFLSFSCSNDRDTTQQANGLEETPEVLDKGKSDLDLSYRKSMYKDIIQELYEEALDKDEKLKSINTRITQIKDIKKDSLENFETYIRNNQNYWNALDHYANQLSDTTLRDELKSFIEILESKYTDKTVSLNSLAKRIETSEQSLRDHEILMKIIVTGPMMNNYQRNERPDINTLKSVKRSFDSLINDVKPYTKIIK